MRWQPLVTLGLQALVAVVTVAFGAVAWRVWRAVERPGEPAAQGWRLTGGAFLLLGASSVVQVGIGAPWAYFSGAGSPVYEAYIRWLPLGNYSRAGLTMAFALALAALPRAVPRLGPRAADAGLAACVAGAVAGAVFGRHGLTAQHWEQMAIAGAAELVLLLAALAVGVTVGSLDRFLWLALVVFAVHEVLHVVQVAALAWAATPGAWSPPPMLVHSYPVIAYAWMIRLTRRRLAFARAGLPVGPLFDPSPTVRRFGAP